MHKQKIRDILLIVLAAWLTNLVQISFLVNLSLFGGQPNLIAIGAIVFLMLGKFNAGLIWIASGGFIFDALLGAPGITTLPLLAAYGLSYLLVRHLFNDMPILIALAVGLILLASSELILAFSYNNWEQFVKDLSFGVLILLILIFSLKEKYLRRNTA